MFLNLETITGNACSSREFYCKTNKGCFSMLCHHWSLYILTIDCLALVLLPYLLPAFALFGTWGKLPKAAAAPDLWQGIDGWHLLPDQPLLPWRKEPEFCLSCSNQSASPSHSWCLGFHVLGFIILYFPKLVGPWLLTLRWLTLVEIRQWNMERQQ